MKYEEKCDFMRIDEQIKMLCVKSGISMSKMARRLNKSPQTFSQKIKRGIFTIDELMDISILCGCELKCEFVYPNGDRINVE